MENTIFILKLKFLKLNKIILGIELTVKARIGASSFRRLQMLVYSRPF